MAMRGARTVQGAFVSIGSTASAPSIINFQYNPVTVERTLTPLAVGGEEGDRSEAVRFTGAPSQTISIEIDIDATSALDAGDPVAMQYGIHPQLAALELLVYPTSQVVTTSEGDLQSGAMEIAPMTAPRTLFVWGQQRVLPVRLTGYTIREELFDANLNPIRATVTANMRVLTYSDLVIGNADYQQFMAYQKNLETLAAKAARGSLAALGVASSAITS